MARAQELTELKKILEKVLTFKRDQLISRQGWGEITLENASQDIDRIFSLANHLQLLPIELLPDTVMEQTREQLRLIAEVFQRIDQFRISNDSNPSNTRNVFITQLHDRADQFFNTCAQWIPFLAYQKGDVAQNIKNLTDAVGRAENYTNETKAKIAERAQEIENIITKAREASAAAGAAVFTRDFKEVADNQENDAGFWLKITLGAAVITLAVAFAMWFWTESGLDQGQLFQKLSTKLVVLAVLLSATVWCGRNYKALKHLATINRHRALSIQTLQAFAAAASDAQTKDSVLLEATRAVFGSVPTGYIEGGGDSDLKIVEIARSIFPKTEKP